MELANVEDQAPHNEKILIALRAKHPTSPRNLNLLEGPDVDPTVPSVATVEGIRKAINSFRSGSAASLNGLGSGHLRVLVGRGAEEAGKRLVTTLTGASLCALGKKDGGVHPIAVGNTLRRLATKVGALHTTSRLGAKLRPVQLGFSTKQLHTLHVNTYRVPFQSGFS